ncbi:hypothetical protein KSP40_PGU019463 [Platanthera guangdongensis]|uniref:Uncharacterized protein n=1 Tax=Platanthera guangdongensis TaxID=2320717 RepID=A0ABR2MUC0_9ASPA
MMNRTFFISKFRRRRLKTLAQNVNHIHPHVLELDSPEEAMEGSEDECLQKGMDLSSSCMPLSHPEVTEIPNGLSDGSSYKVDEKLQKCLYGEAQLLSTRQKSESYGSENHLALECTEHRSFSPDTAAFCVATAQASTSNDCTQPMLGSHSLSSTMLQFAKTRRLSVERGDPRRVASLYDIVICGVLFLIACPSLTPLPPDLPVQLLTLPSMLPPYLLF